MFESMISIFLSLNVPVTLTNPPSVKLCQREIGIHSEFDVL